MELSQNTRTLLAYVLWDTVGFALILFGFFALADSTPADILGLFTNEYQAMLVGIGAVFVVAANVWLIYRLRANRRGF